MYDIDASVGKGGKNQKDDVIAIQCLLNRHALPKSWGKPLKLDGDCGVRTTDAILEFQHRAMNMQHPDGLISPDGPTLAVLNKPNTHHPVHITCLSNVVLDPAACQVIVEIAQGAGLKHIQVNCAYRSAHDQAKVMYDNCHKNKKLGVAGSKRLYKALGQTVVDVYVKNRDKDRDSVIALMEAKIKELGPERVSKHSDVHYFTLDLQNFWHQDSFWFKQFEASAWAHPAVEKVLPPPHDPAFHIEIPKSAIGRGTSGTSFIRGVKEEAGILC